ncbi:hypothetical protein GCM10011397_20190 [Wenyingzhuangia marina]|nr:hypothetical protein GCM10011397_20190 [Wenyingzhuangia marina]
MTLINAKPPGNDPTNVLAKAMSRWAIPPLFINCPDNTKKGMANREKLSNPVPILWETVVNAGITGILTSIVNTEEMAILQATGVPMVSKIKKLTTNTNSGKNSIIIMRLKDLLFYNK